MDHNINIICSICNVKKKDIGKAIKKIPLHVHEETKLCIDIKAV